MVLPNPNWPLVAQNVDFTVGPPGTSGTNAMSLEAPQRRNAVRQFQIQRGRQYELDQVQAGTYSGMVVDPQENLNPQNGSSPFLVNSGKLLPYRALNVIAMWPQTGNLISTTMAAGYDPSFESSTGGFFVKPGSFTTLTVSSAQHFVGTKSLLVGQGGNTSLYYPFIQIYGVPGITVTVSVYAYLTGGCHLQIQCPDGSNSSVLTTQTTWTRLTVTYTQVDAGDFITFAGTAVANPSFYLDAVQAEYGTTASAFTTSGPTRYSLYSGYVERFPTVYDMAGKRANGTLTGVDALAILARTVINQSYLSTITADSPALFLPLTDANGPGVFKIGGQYWGVDNDISATGAFTWGSDQFLNGDPAMTMSQRNPANPAEPGSLDNTQITEWNNLTGSVAINTKAVTLEVWVKYTAGIVTPLQIAVISDGVTVGPDQQYILLSSRNTGRLQAEARDTAIPYGPGYLPVQFGYGLADGQWHYYAVSLNTTSGQTILTHSDLNSVSSGVISPALSSSWGINNVHFDVTTDLGCDLSQMSLYGFALYTRDIGSTVRQNHYLRGTGYKTEMSGARVSRLLGIYWLGGSTVATGYAKMAEDFSYNTRTMLDVLEEIQDTERGLLFADVNGNVVFQDRTTRYNSKTSLWTLGENAAGGELPYVDYQADFDPTYTFTQANLTRPGNSTFAPIINTTTQALYGQRILTQTVQVCTDFDLTQAAIFYLARYGTPKPRIAKLTLNPAANPSLWPMVLGLEISQRITVKRRSDSLTTSNDYYVEQITHNVNSDAGTWTVDLQLSPVFNPTAWFLGDATYGVLGTTTIPVY